MLPQQPERIEEDHWVVVVMLLVHHQVLIPAVEGLASVRAGINNLLKTCMLAASRLR